MDDMNPQVPDAAGWRRLTPRAGVRTQLVAAATTWLVGLGFLLVRGVLLVEEPAGVFRWNLAIVPVAVLAVVLGVVKARLVLVRYAHKAVDRITGRGRACFFGFFSWTSWGFIVVMMGGGTLLRHSPLVDSATGRALLSVVYIAVGTALLIADRVLWAAALAPAGERAGERRRLLAGQPTATGLVPSLDETA